MHLNCILQFWSTITCNLFVHMIKNATDALGQITCLSLGWYQNNIDVDQLCNLGNGTFKKPKVSIVVWASKWHFTLFTVAREKFSTFLSIFIRSNGSDELFTNVTQMNWTCQQSSSTITVDNFHHTQTYANIKEFRKKTTDFMYIWKVRERVKFNRKTPMITHRKRCFRINRVTRVSWSCLICVSERLFALVKIDF